LPRPESTNSSTKPTVNRASESIADAAITTAVARAIAPKFHSVTLAPPMLSASRPPIGRISEPSSGPMKVTAAACSGVRPNWVCRTRPKAKLYPMNEPNVPM
jgi:hypothetical protein